MEKFAHEEKKREREIEKRKRKIEMHFIELLYSLHIKPTTPYEEARIHLHNHAAFQNVPTEEERLVLYKEYCEKRGVCFNV
jgi:hypothetical protein